MEKCCASILAPKVLYLTDTKTLTLGASASLSQHPDSLVFVIGSLSGSNPWSSLEFRQGQLMTAAVISVRAVEGRFSLPRK